MAMASIYTFSIESMILDYHKYIVVWNNPVVGEDSLCEREVTINAVTFFVGCLNEPQ